MSPPLIISLPYVEDSAYLFESVRDHAWPIWLDSGRPYSKQGRYDIIVADPIATVVTSGDTTTITQAGEVIRSQADPTALLWPWLNPTVLSHSDAPFAGGAVGYFGYDLARRFERLPNRATEAERIPEMAIGIYNWAVVVDHEKRTATLASSSPTPETIAQQDQLVKLFSSRQQDRHTVPFHLLSDVAANLDLDDYAVRFNKLKRYITDGDCYQVNLTRRFSARAGGDPWTAYRNLRRGNPAPMGAYLQLPFVQVLSSSPEGFLKVRDGQVETKPIKGTRPVRNEATANANEICELKASHKDRAENVMIVDLMRNDLGKVCEAGSVRVPKLFEVESFATVHHLVSTVTGTLRKDRDAIDLLRACFPGGSITGAPKLRAMEIVEELEPHRRGLYCGAIGYIGRDGAMGLNIAIRTLVYSEGQVRFWAGGGIVADSVMESEFQETLDKAQALLRLLQQGPRVPQNETDNAS
ncbi:MAG: aminodeoxychorismate synthase component I [Burkholderiales bacterium]